MAQRVRKVGLIGSILKGLGGLIQNWPLMAIMAFFVSPVGPHLRWQYSYYDGFGSRSYIECSYWGSRGLVEARTPRGCPVVIWHDARRAPN